MAKKKKKNSSNIQTLIGKLQIVKNGMGFVSVEGIERDIIIRRDGLGNALDGDEVKVEIRGFEKKGRQDGVITKVCSQKSNGFQRQAGG